MRRMRRRPPAGALARLALCFALLGARARARRAPRTAHTPFSSVADAVDDDDGNERSMARDDTPPARAALSLAISFDLLTKKET